MATFVTIPSADRDPESPVTPELIDGLYNNPIAQGEGDSSVPAAQRNIKHLIGTATASASATVDFDNVLDGAYNRYEVELINVLAATDQDYLNIIVQTGGSTWQTGTVYTSATNAADARIRPPTLSQLGNVAGEEVQGLVILNNPASTTKHKGIQVRIDYKHEAGLMTTQAYSGKYNATTAVTGVRFYMSAGNIASGEFRLYGISA